MLADGPEREDGRTRVVIEAVEPQVDGGRFAVKRIVGDEVEVRADVFADGHDQVAAHVLHRGPGDREWRAVPMRPLGNDRWAATLVMGAEGVHRFAIEGWIDRFATWRSALGKRVEAGQDVAVDLLIGAALIEEAAARAAESADGAVLARAAAALRGADREAAVAAALDSGVEALVGMHAERRFVTRTDRDYPIVVDRERARFSAWYERFPRSSSPQPGRHGTLRDLGRLVPEIARMGFDVLYLPPIHPIGRTHRKGANNAPEAGPGDPGSPWAIGAGEGGHTAIHPELGTMEDFARLVESARAFGLEVALDLALQCSPDHPWVREHPQWFRHRPDGTIQYAENPPKKYQDIYPIDFETEDWRSLWAALRDVVLFWVARGVRIFRVDNPHTKPFAFWEWLIGEVKAAHPDVLFLSEAFTRPKVMYRLAKLGFTQSYTYFTWRTTKAELTQYLTELTQSPVREFFRPNFWPNTPDILPEHLQVGGRPAFVARLVLAATMSSSYGIYGPPFELCVADALPGREEYRDSEKYQIRHWDWNAPGHLRDLIARVNRIRRENPALKATDNLAFVDVDDDRLVAYLKASADGGNVLLVVVSLDPDHRRSGRVRLPLARLGLGPSEPFLVEELLEGDQQIWQGEANLVEIDPRAMPARIFRIARRLRRETDFDYFYM
ncbi:MAG TPA: alpha-1,4-glucan--maltose-1-phosphate maltosyltransferase [Thermodesulfobacteriota bacterium]